MSKNPEEAMDFLSYVAEVSRGWDEPNAREVGRMKSQPNDPNAKAGMYTVNEDIDMKAKVAAIGYLFAGISIILWLDQSYIATCQVPHYQDKSPLA